MSKKEQEHIEWCECKKGELYGSANCTCPGFEYYLYYKSIGFNHEQSKNLSLSADLLYAATAQERGRRQR